MEDGGRRRKGGGGVDAQQVSLPQIETGEQTTGKLTSKRDRYPDNR